MRIVFGLLQVFATPIIIFLWWKASMWMYEGNEISDLWKWKR